MPDCCDPTPYRRFFNRKEADRNVRSYRKRGLDPMAKGMIDFLVSGGVGASGGQNRGGGH